MTESTWRTYRSSKKIWKVSMRWKVRGFHGTKGHQSRDLTPRSFPVFTSVVDGWLATHRCIGSAVRSWTRASPARRRSCTSSSWTPSTGRARRFERGRRRRRRGRPTKTRWRASGRGPWSECVRRLGRWPRTPRLRRLGPAEPSRQPNLWGKKKEVNFSLEAKGFKSSQTQIVH